MKINGWSRYEIPFGANGPIFRGELCCSFQGVYPRWKWFDQAIQLDASVYMVWDPVFRNLSNSKIPPRDHEKTYNIYMYIYIYIHTPLFCWGSTTHCLNKHNGNLEGLQLSAWSLAWCHISWPPSRCQGLTIPEWEQHKPDGLFNGKS